MLTKVYTDLVYVEVPLVKFYVVCEYIGVYEWGVTCTKRKIAC